jgi:hypothetical protein
LRNVEEVVEQRLPGMRGEEVKLVDHKDDRFGRYAVLSLCYLGGMGQQSEKRCHGVGVVGGLLVSVKVGMFSDRRLTCLVDELILNFHFLA